MYVLQDVPLDPTYDHTLFLQNRNAQTSYFIGKAKYTFNSLTYQRVNRGAIRVETKVDNLYDCNYLMFQNTAYGTKWFYAFITSVNYINDIVSEINYQIDVMQTWAYDYQLDWCFVEREHTDTDDPGDNLVPEGLETGEYIGSGWRHSNFCNNLKIVIAATFDADYQDSSGGFYSGLYSGLTLHTFDNTPEGAQEAEAFITGAGAKSAGIVSIYLCPSFFISRGAYPQRATFTLGSRPASIDGYTPRNKKLLTYPYTFIYITNVQGSSAALPYEYFGNPDNCVGAYYGTCTPNNEVIFMPNNYKGYADDNPDEKIVMTGFPQVAYATDLYRAWLAQQASSLATNAISNTMASAGLMATKGAAMAGPGGAVAGAVAGAAGGLLSSAFSVAREMYQHSIMPDQGHSGAGAEALVASNFLEFYVANKHITAQFARRIDDYFDRFGYAVNQILIPNRSARREWSYVKTIGCTATGSIPGDDMRQICDLFNAGITFWKHPENVGNYKLDNSPDAGW